MSNIQLLEAAEILGKDVAVFNMALSKKTFYSHFIDNSKRPYLFYIDEYINHIDCVKLFILYAQKLQIILEDLYQSVNDIGIAMGVDSKITNMIRNNKLFFTRENKQRVSEAEREFMVKATGHLSKLKRMGVLHRYAYLKQKQEEGHEIVEYSWLLKD